MAGTIPQPRSYQSILGDMLDAFLSRYGLRGLRVGGPLLGILESAAQSDVRGAQDIFNLLDATDVDRATGIALDRLANDEDLTRLPVSPSSGAVTISDTSFVKISSKVYAGAAAPNSGTTSLKVADASSFPSTGSIYIGRGTVNYEGPIAYTAPTQVGTYWTLTLSTPTQKFHDVNESIVLSKGGNRSISAGTAVKTGQDSVSEPVTFTTLNEAVILDGETEVTGVDVVCSEPGVIGNVPKGAVMDFASDPFVGAAVTNPLPFDNGQPAEDDAALRERIKAARQSRARGTPLALITNAKGVQALDENKTVISASVFSPQGEPTTLFIDDGTGYEHVSTGVAIETLTDQALGGEDKFKLVSGVPVAKASTTTTLTSPFGLVAGAKLAVKIAGVVTEHSFSASEFRSISNATAYEVATAINGNSDLLFSARTAANGTKVVLFARADTGEDVEVVSPDSGTDANTYLGFPVGVNYTLKLYKNDRLLYKDGKSAIVTTTPQTEWSPTIASGVYVKVKVDGTAAAVYQITDQDFIDAETGYTSVSYLNSLQSWADVLNSKIPGINAEVASGSLTITSNRGASASAQVVISEPSASDKDTTGTTVTSAINNLVQKGMFTVATGLSAEGRSNDFTLNRNTGELKLTTALASGDVLSAGTEYTRAYLQGQQISTGTVTISGGGKLWLVVDGAATTVSTGVNAATSLSVTAPAGSRRRYTAGSAVFTNVLAGDWVIIWDSSFTVQGAWRVAYVDPGYTYFEVERETAHVNETTAPALNGIVFIRTEAAVQEIDVAAGVNRSLTSIASEINDVLVGATASVYRNKYLRITTDTFALTGDIFLATADVEGQKLKLTRGQLVTNHTSHLPAVESTGSESGTPDFDVGTIAALPGTVGTDLQVSDIVFEPHKFVYWLRRQPSSDVGYGNHAGQWVGIESISGSDVYPRATMSGATVSDRVVATNPFAIGPEDNLTLILDADASTKNYNLSMWRKIKPVSGQSYTATNLQVLDVDNSNQSLDTAFGDDDADFFRDFAVYMKARVKSHGNVEAYTANKALLWRYGRMGPEGEAVRVSYVNPEAPSQSMAILTTNGQYADIKIRLPSDAARTGLGLFGTTRFTVSLAAAGVADDVTFTYSKPTLTLQRVTNVVTATTGSNHGFAAGDIAYVTSSDAAFSSGPKTVVAITDATHFTYNEVGADAGPTAVGTVSSASADPDFTSVQVGDIVTVGVGTDFDDDNKGSFRVSARTATTFTVKRLSGEAVAETTPVAINGTTGLQFFPLVSTTANDIVTWIDANAEDLVSAVAVENGGGSPGTGVIDRATLEEYLEGTVNSDTGVSVQAWTLVDGVNYVLSSDLGASPNTITLKSAVNTYLVSDSDFDNEEMRLVPITVDALVRYLSSPAVSGVYAGAEIEASVRGSRLQISSTTTGSSGAVQITGGSANSVGVSISGSGAVVDTTYSKVTVLASQAKGLVGGQWVAVQGSTAQTKTSPLTTASELQTIAASGDNWLITFDLGTTMWERKQVVDDAGDQWQIDRVGNFVRYTLIDNGAATSLDGSVEEGDWVRIDLADATAANNGTFRVVRKESSSAFWIENENAVSEVVEVGADDYVEFYGYDSAMPGDQLIIDTNAFGTQNRGTFTVIENAGGSNTITVSGDMEAFSGGGVLGNNHLLIRIVEEEPVRAIKRIHTIGRNSGSSDFLDVVFDTEPLATKMSSGAGASIQPLDKLGFSTDLVSGADAYAYETGLIGEVNRVMYGDLSNPSVYPGVVAAGAQVNISGPLVKRVSVALSVRIRSGAVASAIVDRVKSAVASAINRVQIGNPVAISSLVAAAAAVDGVVAVTIISPTYGSGNDLISVQANEKPRVLDIDQDVLVSVVGN